MHLAEKERSQGWLAKRLRVTRQAVGIWARGEEPCPRARQAQIAVTLNEQSPRTQLRPEDLFDRKGYAIMAT
jgi:hypothetical protein